MSLAGGFALSGVAPLHSKVADEYLCVVGLRVRNWTSDCHLGNIRRAKAFPAPIARAGCGHPFGGRLIPTLTQAYLFIGEPDRLTASPIAHASPGSTARLGASRRRPQITYL